MDPDPAAHCRRKIAELVALGDPSPRAILQIGYNLGRLAEITGQGREPYWDRWKDAVTAWDLPRLRELARNLLSSPVTLLVPTSRPTVPIEESC